MTTKTKDSNVEAVRTKLRDRMRAGLRKYGVTTERTDLTRKQWLTHAQEEAMDLAVYLERILSDSEELQRRVEISKDSMIEYDLELTALRSKFNGLKEYAEHKSGCDRARSFAPCTCGLDHLIREELEDTES